MSTIPKRRHAARRILLDGIGWKDYSRMLRIFAHRSGIRLAYDRGRLEIMSPLFEHETDADFLGRLVVVLTEELGQTVKSALSTTFRRRSMQRGLEADHSYYIAHEPQIRGKRRIDLETDTPDLAIEIDLTSRSINRMPIYRSLGVPEVWRLDGGVLTFRVLNKQKRYKTSATSLAFPFVTPADLMAFLPLRATLDENAVVAQFRLWVRQKQAGSATP